MSISSMEMDIHGDPLHLFGDGELNMENIVGIEVNLSSKTKWNKDGGNTICSMELYILMYLKI